jgi:hypothetical protein
MAKRRRNAELSEAHKALQAQFKASAESQRLWADQRGAVAEMPGTHKDNRKRLREEAEYFNAQSQRFFQAATRTPFLTSAQVAPLAVKLRRATPKQVAELASTVLDLYRRRVDAQEADEKARAAKAATVAKKFAPGGQGSLFAPKSYRVQTIVTGQSGDLFSPVSSVPASLVSQRVKLDAKRASSFERDARYRERVLEELRGTVRATGQALAVEGPRGNVLAVLRLTEANPRRRRRSSARACACSSSNPRGTRAAVDLSRAESARWHKQDKATIAEVLEAARAAVRETGLPVIVRDADGVTVATARQKRARRR